MDMGHTIDKANETITNVIDLCAYRLQKQNALAQQGALVNVPREINDLLVELSQLVKEGEQKFQATL